MPPVPLTLRSTGTVHATGASCFRDYTGKKIPLHGRGFSSTPCSVWKNEDGSQFTHQIIIDLSGTAVRSCASCRIFSCSAIRTAKKETFSIGTALWQRHRAFVIMV